MHYQFADGHAFPLQSNFLTTLEATVRTAAELLELDQTLVVTNRHAHPANQQASVQLEALQKMEGELRQLLAKQKHSGARCRRTAVAIWQDATARIEKTRRRIESWRDRACRTHRRDHIASSVLQILEKFSLHHELPNSDWGFRWIAGNQDRAPEAQVYALCPGNLSLSFGVDFPPSHRWSGAPKVADFSEGFHLQLRGYDWRGRGRTRTEQLDKYLIARVTRTRSLESVVLARRSGNIGLSFRICYRVDNQACCTLEYLDETGQPIAAPTNLSGLERQEAQRLWQGIQSSTADLIEARARLLTADIDGTSLAKLTRTRAIAKALIAAVAPLCTQVVRRSNTLTELKLKRSLGGGRREELFVNARRLRNAYRKLSLKNQRLFDVLHLENQAARSGASPGVVDDARKMRQRRPHPARHVSQDQPGSGRRGTTKASQVQTQQVGRGAATASRRKVAAAERNPGPPPALASRPAPAPPTQSHSRRRVAKANQPAAQDWVRSHSEANPPPQPLRTAPPPPPAREHRRQAPPAATESYPIALVRPLRPRQDSNAPTLRIARPSNRRNNHNDEPSGSAPPVDDGDRLPESQRRTTKIGGLQTTAAASKPATQGPSRNYALPKPKLPPRQHAS
jgi:hypothetical protein